MLELVDFEVFSGNRKLAGPVNLKIKKREMHILMGPNGSGKSSLCFGIMGSPSYKTKGKIFLDGNPIFSLLPDERAKKGLFLCFQNPEEVEGVTLDKFFRKLEKKAEIPERFKGRELNVGFSGGEKKLSELLQMELLDRDYLLIDEIDSGVDVDMLKEIASRINRLHKKGKAIFLVTHYTRILSYLSPDKVHLIKEGIIVKEGDASLAHQLEKEGYNGA